MIALLDPHDHTTFPDAGQALREPNGLLAVGGDLSPTRLEHAYRHGIFPWFSSEDPILWWSPDPRTVLFPDRIHISRSLRKRLRKQDLAVSLDRCFDRVISGCAAPREETGDTWLVPRMIEAYHLLHLKGLAHSVEVWSDGELVGGLYGVAIGKVFFGESMFSRTRDASKIALVQLCQRLSQLGFELIDCQMRTEHLISMGAVEMPRREFIARLGHLCESAGPGASWDDGSLHFPASTSAAPMQHRQPKPP